MSLVFVTALLAASQLQAQSCTVSVSIASTSTTPSTACFVPPNGVASVAITGTWTGTADIQRSTNGGTAYSTIQQTTANDTFVLDPVGVNSLVRVFFSTGTTGTLTGTINYNPTGSQGRIAYSNVPIGSVAYGSFGNDGASGGSTKIELSDLIVPSPGFQTTGAAVLLGATTSTNTIILALYDARGNIVANTATAGTITQDTANTFQQIAWSVPVFLAPGRYYLGSQVSNTTTTFRRIATLTFIDVVCGEVTGATYGTLTKVVTPPTKCTAAKAPIGYVY